MDIRENMRTGRLYIDAGDAGLQKELAACKELLYDFNNTRPSETEKRGMLLKELLGDIGNNVWIEPPLHMAYGKRTHMGNNVYANFNLVIVDDIDVYIGNNVMFAPNVTITATGHPVCADLRKHGEQFSFPVHIEDDVWIGTGVIILPGITIGKGSVIGAGSVVTKNIPSNVVAVGNPCHVMRPITDHDREYYYKDFKVDNH